MEQMLPQELMNLVIIMELSTTPLKMLDPVKTCILNIKRKTLFHSTVFYISHKHTGSIQATDISSKRGRHKLHATLSQSPMRLLLIHPEMGIIASGFVEKEVTK